MAELLNEFMGVEVPTEWILLFGSIFLLIILITVLKIIILVVSSFRK